MQSIAALANTAALSVLRKASKTLQTGANGCSAAVLWSPEASWVAADWENLTALNAPNRGRHPDLILVNEASTSSQIDVTTYGDKDLLTYLNISYIVI